MVVPNTVVPSNTVTVALASALPVITGFELFVIAFGAIVGVVGAVKSTTKLSIDDVAPVFPAVSVAVAVTLCVPSTKALVGVSVQCPFESATTEPNVVEPSFTTTTAPASVVPEITGLVLLVGPF